jgi:glutaredoxin
MIEVSVYSRSNCHLCEVALEVIGEIRKEFEFTISKILIDGNAELEEKYGEQVPVILINNQPHDFFRVDPERFRLAISRTLFWISA